MDITVKVINAFSIQNTGGNPAGVVFNADSLSNAAKQKVAALAGFTETAFVSRSHIADFKLDFFTPTKQIPHCGHATIATFTYLKQHGKITGTVSSKETIDGNRVIQFKDNFAYMEQRAPTFITPEEDFPFILESLHLTAADLKDGFVPTVVNTGNSFLLVPLREEALLPNLQRQNDLIYQLSAKYNLIGYYVFASPQENKKADATTRMFGPFYGIDEEAATGMAAGPLATFLYAQGLLKKEHYLIEQGRFMSNPSPSQIHVHLETEKGDISRLFVGGDAYISGEKTVTID